MNSNAAAATIAAKSKPAEPGALTTALADRFNFAASVGQCSWPRARGPVTPLSSEVNGPRAVDARPHS